MGKSTSEKEEETIAERETKTRSTFSQTLSDDYRLFGARPRAKHIQASHRELYSRIMAILRRSTDDREPRDVNSRWGDGFARKDRESFFTRSARY